MTDVHLPDDSVALFLSSDRDSGVRDEAAAIGAHLAAHPDLEPVDVARMLLRTRAQRRYRAVVRAHDRDDALAGLAALAAGAPHPSVFTSRGPAEPRRVALVFPGQGSQRAGMARDWYERCPDFRRHVDELDAEFVATVGISPATYLLEADHPEDVTIVQPAIFLHTLALARTWRDAGLEPAATIGHSQGEFAAVIESGQMTLPDGIRMVTDRARHIADVENNGRHAPSAMAVIGAPRAQIEDQLARHTGWAELAVVNSATIHAISGDRRAVDTLVAEFGDRGVFARRIAVDHAGHSSLLRHYRAEFASASTGLTATAFAPGHIPCYGGTLGTRVTPDLPITDYWHWNLRNMVRFDLAIAAAAADGINAFVEMSAHPTMLLSIGETLAERGAQGIVVGTGKKGADPLDEFTANLMSVLVADSDHTWPAARPGKPIADFPATCFADSAYWAASNGGHR